MGRSLFNFKPGGEGEASSAAARGHSSPPPGVIWCPLCAAATPPVLTSPETVLGMLPTPSQSSADLSWGCAEKGMGVKIHA